MVERIKNTPAPSQMAKLSAIIPEFIYTHQDPILIQNRPPLHSSLISEPLCRLFTSLRNIEHIVVDANDVRAAKSLMQIACKTSYLNESDYVTQLVKFFSTHFKWELKIAKYLVSAHYMKWNENVSWEQ